MKPNYVLLTLIVLTGCTKPKTNESHSTDQDHVDNTATESLIQNQKDTLSYIGYIEKFEDNNSFYTDLYFADNFDYDRYNEITKMGDHIIFKNEETQRTRIQIEKVGQYFNLMGLRDINIYNSEGIKLTTGRLSHIEYVEDMIESKFVAVFQVEDPNISDPLFCIGNSNIDLIKISFSSYDDKKLKSSLIEFLKLNTDLVSNILHYKLDNEVIYSSISADTTAYIIETIDQANKTLYKSNSSETINELDAIPLKVNGRPILLTVSGLPESDIMWTSVLIFNGTTYEPSKDHRISHR